MNALKSNFCLLLLLLIPVFLPAVSSEVTFNYSGFVRVNGMPQNGPGEFKLAITTSNGNITLWSNDSTSSNGSEPTSSITSPVSNGIFSINVGDPGEGMDPINRALFNNDTKKMRLHIWFSDGVNGFQELLPARKLDNIELLGYTTGNSDLIIYVDAAAGNDDNDGLSTDTAKATVQAGINIIPSFIESPVVVKIFGGTYYESLSLNNVQLSSANGSLSFIGEASNTPVLSGADTGTSTAVRNNVLTMNNCDLVTFENLHFDRSLTDGIFTVNSEADFTDCEFSNFGVHCIQATTKSDIDFFNCLLRDSEYGIRISALTRFGTFSNTVIEDMSNFGVLSFGASYFRSNDSIVRNCGIGGISIREASLMTIFSTEVSNIGFSFIDDVYNIEVLDTSHGKIYGCTITDGAYGGVKSTTGSFIQFFDTGQGPTLIGNCPIGVRAEFASSAYERMAGALTFSGNSTNAQADGSSNLFNIP